MGICLHSQKFRLIICASLWEGVSWGWQEVLVSRWWFWAPTLISIQYTKPRGRKEYTSSFCTVTHWLALLSSRRKTWATFLFGACRDLKVHLKDPRWMLSELERRVNAPVPALTSVLSIFHLVFNRACAGVKPPPSLSPGHRLMLSLP